MNKLTPLVRPSNQLTATLGAPRCPWPCSDASRPAAGPPSTGPRRQEKQRDAMKIGENVMEVVGFVCLLSVLRRSPRRVPERLVAFPKRLAPNRGFRSAAASRRCRWALWGGGDDASGPVRVGGMTKGFRTSRSPPRGGATPSAALPEEAGTLGTETGRNHASMSDNLINSHSSSDQNHQRWCRSGRTKPLSVSRADRTNLFLE